MSKNLTRKSLAIGAAIALGISGIAALPANSAGLADTSFVSLAPTTGTEYSVLAGTGTTEALRRSFTLNANEASSVVGGKLKFLVNDASRTIFPDAEDSTMDESTTAVEDNSTVALISATDQVVITDASLSDAVVAGDYIGFTDLLKIDDGSGGSPATIALANTPFLVDAVNTTTDKVTFTSTTDITAAMVSSAAGQTDGAETAVIYPRRDVDSNFVVDSGIATAATIENLELHSFSNVTTSVTVQAWIDSNVNNKIDSTEYASPVRTVTFAKRSEVVATTVLTQPELNESSLDATVTTVPVLNGNQLVAGDIFVKFTKQDFTDTFSDTTASWSDTTKKFSFNAPTATTAPAPVWTGNVIAGIYSATATVGTTAGATDSKTVAAKVADSLDATVAASANTTFGTNSDSGSATTVEVRKGTTDAVTIKVEVFDQYGDAVAAGVNVKATVGNFAGAGTYKVNGTAVLTGEVATVATDAKGIATFTVTSSAAAITNGLSLTFNSQGITPGVGTAAIVLDWNAASYSIKDVDDRSASALSSIFKGGSRTYNFAVVDQFTQPLAGDYRLKMALTSHKVQTMYSSKLASGRASMTVVDDEGTNAAGVITVNVALQSLESGAWANADGTDDVGAAALGALSITVIATQTDAVTLTNDVDAIAPGTSDKDASVANSAVGSYDSRFELGTAPSATDNAEGRSDEVVVVAGSVGNAATATGRSGAQVTISGAGLVFRQGSTTVWGKDSLTIFANSSGQFDFKVASNKAVKDQVVTITSGGATKTVKVTFTGIDTESLTISAPTSVKSGRTVLVTVNFYDMWGNLATDSQAPTTLATSGPGWMTAFAPSTTGTATAKLVTTHGDEGAATFTVTSLTTDVYGDKLTATTATWVGPVVNATASATKGRVVISTYAAKGKTVKVYVGSKLRATFVADTFNDKFVLKGVKSGARNVEVRLVGPGKDYTGAITVK